MRAIARTVRPDTDAPAPGGGGRPWLPALLIGAVYNRWRQLRWCVLLHAGMNAVWLAVMLTNRAA